MGLIHLHCAGCKSTPAEIPEYVYMAVLENTTPDQFVQAEEGTLDRATGAFLCTECYTKYGQPSGKVRWTATPVNLLALGLV